jgi:GGDEF domain-containing protein
LDRDGALSYTTLEKFLNRSSACSSASAHTDKGTEQDRAYRDLLEHLFASLEAHILSGEEMTNLTGEFAGVRAAAFSETPDVAGAARSLGALLDAVRNRREQADRERREDFRKVLATLNEAFLQLSTGSERHDARWKQLEDSLQLASRTEDIRTLKHQLTELITYVQRESDQEQKERVETLNSLGARVQAAYESVNRFGASLAGREEAIAHLRRASQTPKGPKYTRYLAMFAVDTALAIRKRHGNQVANSLLEDFARERIAVLLPESVVFRWSPESIVAVWQSDRELSEMASYVANASKSPFEYRAFLGSRVASFSLAYRTVVSYANGQLDDVILSLDRFARGA